MRRGLAMRTGMACAAILAAGCTTTDAPTEPGTMAPPPAHSSRARDPGEPEGFRPINLSSPVSGLNSEAYDINFTNQSAGVIYSAGETVDGQAVVWNTPSIGGGNVIGRPIPYAAAVAYALTDAMIVAVTAYQPNGMRAFVWTVGSGFLPVAMPPGTSDSEAKDISNTNIIVGSFVRGGVRRAYRIAVGSGFDNLHPGAPYDASGAEAVSANGTVTGWARIGGNTHAARWSPSGTFVDLGAIGGAAAGLDLNVSGVIAGAGVGLAGNQGYGFLWRPGIGFSMQPPPVTAARGISDRGRVVGVFAPDQPGSYLTPGQPTFLPMPLAATTGRANAVNRCGHSVGAVYSGLGGASATFWQISACD